jgi:hypothetical protein
MLKNLLLCFCQEAMLENEVESDHVTQAGERLAYGPGSLY